MADAEKPHTETGDFVSREEQVSVAPHELPRSFFATPEGFGSFYAMTLSYLPVVASPLIVSLGYQFVVASYPASADSVFMPSSHAIGQVLGFIVVGRLSDIFGRRWFVIAGNVCSMIGFMVAARADSLQTNIGGTFLFGIGTAVQLISVTFLLELVPFDRRYLAYAYVISAWGPILAIAPGASFTFFFYTDETWRWIGYILFIASFAALVMVILFYHPPSPSILQPGQRKAQKLRKVDWLGTFIFTGSTISFILGIDLGGQRYAWKSARTIVPLVIGGVGWIVTLAWEFFTRGKFTSQIFPLLINRNFVMLTLTISFAAMAWTAPSTLYLQQVVVIFQQPQLVAAWYYGLVMAAPVLGQTIGGASATSAPTLKLQLLVAVIILATFGPALAAYSSTQIAMSVMFVLASGTGFGISEVMCTVGALQQVNPDEFGGALAVYWVTRKIATSIASAVFTEILNSKSSTNIQGIVVPAIVQAGLPPAAVPDFLSALTAGQSTLLQQIPGVTTEIITIAQNALGVAMYKSFKVVYLSSIAFAGCAIITTLATSSSKYDAGRTPIISRRLNAPNLTSSVKHGVSIVAHRFGTKRN